MCGVLFPYTLVMAMGVKSNVFRYVSPTNSNYVIDIEATQRGKRRLDDNSHSDLITIVNLVYDYSRYVLYCRNGVLLFVIVCYCDRPC